MVQAIRTVPVSQVRYDKDPSPRKHALRALPLKDIVPSPFQRRTDFDPDKLGDLAKSIRIVGLIYPILVRPVGKYLELIAGERRFRAIRDYTDMQTIEAKIMEIDDIGARRLSAAENIQREDLTAFETIEAIVELVDSELADDPEYALMGPNSVDRVRALLGKLDSVRSSQERGSNVSARPKALFYKFVEQVEQIFRDLPKPLEWLSFYLHNLNLIVESDQKVRHVSIKNKLSKSQTSALGKLKKVSKDHFEALIQESQRSRNKDQESDGPSSRKRRLRDFSAVEINAITETEIKKQRLAEQEISRETVALVSKVKVLLMCRLSIPIDIIASRLKIDWKTAKKYSQDGALLRSIRDALGNGLSVPAAAIKLAVPEPLVWAIALEGKSDKDRFDALGWKIRTWDYWYWNKCLPR